MASYSWSSTLNAAVFKCCRLVRRTGVDIPPTLTEVPVISCVAIDFRSRPLSLVHASLELQPQSLGGELHQWRHLSACGDEIPHQFGAADLLLAGRNRRDKVLHLQVVDKGVGRIESTRRPR